MQETNLGQKTSACLSCEPGEAKTGLRHFDESVLFRSQFIGGIDDGMSSSNNHNFAVIVEHVDAVLFLDFSKYQPSWFSSVQNEMLDTKSFTKNHIQNSVVKPDSDSGSPLILKEPDSDSFSKFSWIRIRFHFSVSVPNPFSSCAVCIIPLNSLSFAGKTQDWFKDTQ